VYAEPVIITRRDLSTKRYVYVWADGIHLEARPEDEKQRILVLIGATPEGKKELVGFTDGGRESAADCCDLLVERKRRGLAIAPELIIADGAVGLWKAAGEVRPKAREAVKATSSSSIGMDCRGADARIAHPALHQVEQHTRLQHPNTKPVPQAGARRSWRPWRALCVPLRRQRKRRSRPLRLRYTGAR
jgi:hypothetical protein